MAAKKEKRFRLTRLTAAEEKAFDHGFRYHVTTSKQGGDRAFERAWRDLRKEFPRLTSFDGVRS